MHKVLLVDDDPINNFLNKNIIRELISPLIPVKAFLNPEEALQYLIDLNDHHKEDLPDFIFLDINMPEMSGFEFLDLYIENKLDKLPIQIYILTSSLDPNDLEVSKLYPIVQDLVSKPLKGDIVRRILV